MRHLQTIRNNNWGPFPVSFLKKVGYASYPDDGICIWGVCF